MSVICALILGIIQGITEFLPISSSGHLTLAEGIMGLVGDNNFFNVLLHLSTLLSVFIVLWKEIKSLIVHPFSKPTLCIVVATIPTVIIGAIVKFWVPELFSVTFLGFGFLITATYILATELLIKPAPNLGNKNIGPLKSFAIGISQGIAVLPGLSRSGVTICTARILGTDKQTAFKFSFLLSIPVILGSIVLEFSSGISNFSHIGFIQCAVGSVTAFITSLITLKMMLKLARKNWLWFSIYLFLLAFATLTFTFAF